MGEVVGVGGGFLQEFAAAMAEEFVLGVVSVVDGERGQGVRDVPSLLVLRMQRHDTLCRLVSLRRK